MFIPQVHTQKQNFNAFVSWQNNSGEPLKKEEIQTLNFVKTILDRQQSKQINIIGEIVPPCNEKSNTKRVRFLTYPLQRDISIIQAQPRHKNAQVKDYSEASRWFNLGVGLDWSAVRYLNKRISFIQYCARNPYHQLPPSGK